jgi:glycosyltransferase involved in cell wall biosynthesis
MKDKPLVSVFIPVYNAEKYIVEVVESIVNQNYENIELVISDDASKDNTPKILEELFKKYPSKIKLFLQEKNLGITKNCNFLLSKCTGDFIVFTAGDDMMKKTKIMTQVDYMTKNPKCNLSFHNYQEYNWETRSYGKIQYKSKKPVKIRNINDYILSGGNTITVMLKNNIKQINLEYDSRCPTADTHFFIEYLIKTNNFAEVHYIDEILVLYGRHENNLTTKSLDILENKLLTDVLISNSILVSKYPIYAKTIFKRTSNLLREYRNKVQGGKQYKYLLYASLKVNFSFKTLALLILYFIGIKK